jgi:cytochrome c
MAFRGIGDPSARADLIAFLEQAGAPGGAEKLVQDGVIPEAYLRAQAPEPLGDAPPNARVTAVRHCGDGYLVLMQEGGETIHWEQNIRLKIDSTETGPPPGLGVIVGAGMQGDRFSVIFPSLADLTALVTEHCPLIERTNP